MRLKAGAAKVGGRTLPKRKGWVGGRTRFGTRTTGSTWANEANPGAVATHNEVAGCIVYGVMLGTRESRRAAR